ncbi:hypothetical protein GCM10027343_41740 [Noviherbaspirillum agri]
MPDKYSKLDKEILHCVWRMDPNEYDDDNDYQENVQNYQPELERLIALGLQQGSMVAHHHVGSNSKNNFYDLEDSEPEKAEQEKMLAIDNLQKAALQGCPGACEEIFLEGLALGMDKVTWGAYSLLLFKTMDRLQTNAGSDFPVGHEAEIEDIHSKLLRQLQENGKEIWDSCGCFG